MPHPHPDACHIFLFTPLLLALGCSTATTFQEHPIMPVRVGDDAPAIDLHLQDGRTANLTAFRGQRAVVLFFYPKDNTPVCTAEACSFRDAYADFSDLDAEVIGVSSDTLASHQQFAEKHRLPYLLASDKDGSLRRAFGVPRTLGFLPGRTTYVIDKAGQVRLVFSAAFSADKHVAEARRVLQTLATE